MAWQLGLSALGGRRQRRALAPALKRWSDRVAADFLAKTGQRDP